MICRIALSALLFGAASLSAAFAQDASFSDDEIKAMDACQRLGLVPEPQRPLVRLVSAEFDEFGTVEEPLIQTSWGVVLRRQGHSVIVFTGKLQERTYVEVPRPNKIGQASIGATTSNDILAAILAPEDEDSEARGWLDSPNRIDRTAELLGLAARCRMRDETAVARKALDALEPYEKSSGLDCALGDLRVRLHWRWVLAFEEPGIERRELLRRGRLWLAEFAATAKEDHVVQARDLCSRLEQQIRAAAKRPALPSDADLEARIDDLIWDLQDFNRLNRSKPPEPGSNGDWGEPDDAFHELEQIGWPAVPALIDAMSDLRTTRTVRYWRDFVFSHSVERVGDIAQEALAAILGAEVWWVSGERLFQVKKDKELIHQKRARAWWDEIGKHGEVTHLERLLETSDGWQRTAQLKRLAQLDRVRAIQVVRDGLRGALGRQAITKAIEDVSFVPGDETEAILLGIWNESRSISNRITAGLALGERRSAGFPQALVTLWPEVLASDGADAPPFEVARSLVSIYFRFGTVVRDKVAASVSDPASRWHQVVRDVWRQSLRPDTKFGSGGSSRRLASRVALEALPLACVEMADERESTRHRWKPSVAAKRLAGWRGVTFDPNWPAERRLVEMRKLVDAERADRGLPAWPVAKTLVAAAKDPPLPPGSVVSLMLSPASEAEPSEDMLTPLRWLIGNVLTAEALEAQFRAAFVRRPKGVSSVLLRIVRRDGRTELHLLMRKRAGYRGWRLGIKNHESVDAAVGHQVRAGQRLDDQPFDEDLVAILESTLAKAPTSRTFVLDVTIWADPR